ncbi:protein kinase domain-containing protein [Gordonia sp. DT30]|uniref:serine/threonine-protein kinase n=1 Tax=Gordonia sp. DT30 TaxID=3416546 RepID=UPI003CF41FB4
MAQERNGSENVTQGDDADTPSGPATTHPQAPPNLGQLRPETVFAGYRIDHVLGHGGMGTVYVAAHPRLPRLDVLKLLNPSFSSDPSFRARFEREADLAGSLEHRNIVSVYDRGVDDGQLWIAMRYVRGYDASALIRGRPAGVDPAFAVHIISEIGTGLDHAHRRGMVHRDVKPANILIESDDDGTTGAIMLTDFGIARAVDDAMHLTDTGLTVASVPYASPEQLHGYELDGRADIYALACTFVELLTGAPPFPRDNRLAAMSAHLHDAPPSVRERVRSLPAGLDSVLAIALAKEPDQRYRTCAEFCYAAAVAIGLNPPPASPLSAGMRTALITSGNSSNPGVAAHNTAPSGPRHTPTSVVSDPRFSDPRFAAPGTGGRVFAPAGNPDTATQLVGNRAPAPVARPRASDHRKTTILVSLATVLALVGVIAGVLAYLNRPNTGTWPAATEPIAQQFSALLPAGPGAQGWGDADCTTSADNGLDAITCSAQSGVHYTVTHTPTPQSRAVVLDALGNQPGTPRIWSEGSVAVSADAVANGWVVTTFADAARAPYTVVATWAGHTGQQVLDEWWRNAPFGS